MNLPNKGTVTVADGVTIARTVCGQTIGWNGTMAYPLTDCCAASGKGSGTGVVCRNCYQPVATWYGDCADRPGLMAGWLAGRRCNDRVECATVAWHQMTGEWC